MSWSRDVHKKIIKPLLMLIVCGASSTMIAVALTNPSWWELFGRWQSPINTLSSPESGTPVNGVLARNVANMMQTSCSGSGVLTGYDRDGKVLCWTYAEMQEALRERISAPGSVGIENCNPDRTSLSRALKGFDERGNIICQNIYAD